MRITLPSGTPAELARPERASGLGVALHPDIGGLRPLFDDLCARLAAEQGWTVCAPEPFPGREAMTLEERMAAVAGLDDERQLGSAPRGGWRHRMRARRGDRVLHGRHVHVEGRRNAGGATPPSSGPSPSTG